MLLLSFEKERKNLWGKIRLIYFWIGFKLVRPGFQERSELKSAGRTNPANGVLRDLLINSTTIETGAQRTEIRWSN
jgi:hypothetical protein